MCWNDSGKECSSNDCSLFYLQGPPGMAFPRPEMYPGHQPGVPPNWNYQQFPAQMPQGLFIFFTFLASSYFWTLPNAEIYLFICYVFNITVRLYQKACPVASVCTMSEFLLLLTQVLIPHPVRLFSIFSTLKFLGRCPDDSCLVTLNVIAYSCIYLRCFDPVV